MSKLIFLLVLNFVAATHDANNDSQSQTNAAGKQTQEPPATRRSYLMTEFDVNLLNGDDSNESQLLTIAKNQLIICAKVVFLVESTDNDYRCVTRTELRVEAHCNNNVKPIIQKLTKKDSNSDKMQDVSCGPKGREGSMFSFGYQACDINSNLNNMPILQSSTTQENLDFFEVYKFCHSKKDNKVIYTEHIIHNPEFLTGIPLHVQQQQDEKYNMMTNGFKYFDSHYETIEKAYQKLKTDNFWTLYNALCTEMNEGVKRSLVEPQQLVPVDDMAFTLTRRPTYHYLNIVPMKIEFSMLWMYMSYLIRAHARENDRIFSINTGAFIVNPREPKELTDMAIEEPEIWIKMIRYEKKASTLEEKGQMESLVIVMNTGLDETRFKEFNDELCENNLCEKAFITYEILSKTRDFVRCCSAEKIARRLFDKELGTEPSFKIEAFTKPETMSLQEEKEYMKMNLDFLPTLV